MTKGFPRRSYNNHVVIVLLSVWLTYYRCHAESLEVNKNKFQCVESERDALLHFKQGISVDDCGLLDAWGHTQNCCQWRGIHCNSQSGHVIGLKLRGPGDYFEHSFCFEGTLSVALLNLTHLKYLDLSNNRFSGQLPKFLGSLASLERLNLSNAGFSGVIPQEIRNLSRLKSLDLKEDNFNLSVDNLWWLSHLRSLREVDLSYIDMSATKNTWLSIVNNLPSLRELRFDECQLSLNLPSDLSYINSSTTLTVLSLKENHLNDTSIFEWLLKLTGLETNLIHLDLSGNHITFGNDLQLYPPTAKLPHSLCSLQTLDMRFNKNLNGKFSDILQFFSMCPRKALVFLRLSYNQVWGSIPDNIGAFSSLKELEVSNNQLNGSIPRSLGQLTMLESLDLSYNSLNETITINHLSNLSKLRNLDLSFNKEVVVKISVDWIPPFQLDTLYLKSSKIGPYFPRWITTQKNLSRLDISNASISDTIPMSFWSSSMLSGIMNLDMSHNMMYGMIPDVSIFFINSPGIDLSYNLFEGEIPTFLRNNVFVLYLNNNRFSKGLPPFLCPNAQMPLFVLDLSNNLFSEKLPNCWSYFYELIILNLENNSLRGNLPSSMGALNKLEYLSLSNNNLSGELPISLLNCTSLFSLDLANNSLVGHIPPSLGHSFKDLAMFNLQNNGFIGVLPTSLCDLSQLQLMDFSGNHISGTIPTCIYKLVSMASNITTGPWESVGFIGNAMDTDLAYIPGTQVMWKRREQIFHDRDSLHLLKGIDLSNNKLQGHIPEGISSLVGLKFLNLSRNNLSGTIMTNIGQLTSLEFLDLSHNHLTGEIPTSLAQISSLSSFNVSENNLTGKIPVSTQLQSFDASSYMGNPGLCGAPLPTCAKNEAPAIVPNGHHEPLKVDEFMLGVYISVILGFIVGFWGVFGSLVVKRSWRHAYFRFYKDVKDKVYVIWVVYIARAWRRS